MISDPFKDALDRFAFSLCHPYFAYDNQAFERWRNGLASIKNKEYPEMGNNLPTTQGDDQS